MSNYVLQTAGYDVSGYSFFPGSDWGSGEGACLDGIVQRSGELKGKFHVRHSTWFHDKPVL